MTFRHSRRFPQLRKFLSQTVFLCVFLFAHAYGEQKQNLGAYEVHYIVVPTTFLQAKIADQYDLVRGRDRSLINLSILTEDGSASTAGLSGHTRNLLEQRQDLDFREVREGDAIYYLALLRHADEEHHRLEIQIDFPDGTSHTLRWQQKLYWDE